MKFYFALPSLFLLAISCSRQPDRCIPRMHVYSIACHDGSIFFSTADSGIFRFPADTASAVRRIASAGHLPIRSIAFGRDGRLYASSYYSGVYYVRDDSLLPLAWAQQPSWSMKFDDDGSLWLAGLHGIYRQQRDSLVKFSAISGGARYRILQRPGCNRAQWRNFGVRHANRAYGQGILQRSNLLDNNPIRYALHRRRA